MAVDYRALFDLGGRIALVAGCGAIGRAAAEALADFGATVAAADLAPALAEETAQAVLARGQRSVAMTVDIADPTSARACVASVVGRYGRLDILVNAAGVNIRKPAIDLEPDEWRRVLDVNLSGVFFLTQAAGRVMLGQRYGKIVTVSSVSGLLGHPNLAAYGSSKGGITVLTKVLAVEWAPFGVTVNAVGPAYTETPLTSGYLAEPSRRQAILDTIPIGRLGLPQDTAAAVVYLASDASSFVTGQTLFVDGGRTAD